MRFPSTVALALALGFAAGCHRAGSSVLGTGPVGDGQPIAEALKPGSGPATVVGEMVEKCPVAGCWFVLRDGTGTLRVDTKSAGFVVVDVPLHTRIVVAGTLVRRGAELELEASAARY